MVYAASKTQRVAKGIALARTLLCTCELLRMLCIAFWTGPTRWDPLPCGQLTLHPLRGVLCVVGTTLRILAVF